MPITETVSPLDLGGGTTVDTRLLIVQRTIQPPDRSLWVMHKLFQFMLATAR